MYYKCTQVFMQSSRSSCHNEKTFLNRFSKNIQISNFMTFRPVGSKLFHADGWTDMTKLIVVCRKFANAPKNNSTTQLLVEFKTSCLKANVAEEWFLFSFLRFKYMRRTQKLLFLHSVQPIHHILLLYYTTVFLTLNVLLYLNKHGKKQGFSK